jgi:WD40 repeat protein
MSLVFGKHAHHKAIDAVLQFLKDQGLENTFQTLVRETHHEYVPERWGNNALLNALQYYEDLKKKESTQDAEQFSNQLLRESVEKSLLDLQAFRSANFLPTQLSREFENVHRGNITCVRFGPSELLEELLGDLWAVAGSVDKSIAFLNIETGDVVLKIDNAVSSAVFAADFNPVFKHLLVISCMDGRCFIFNWINLIQKYKAGELDLEDPSVRIKVHDHGHKYVINVKWSMDGSYFASASNDHTVNVYQIENTRAAENLDQLPSFKKVTNLLFRETPECISWTEVINLYISIFC